MTSHGTSFGSNQRTQGSSLSERTNWSRYRNTGTESVGGTSNNNSNNSDSDMYMSSSTSNGGKSQAATTTTSSSNTTTKTTLITPQNIDDEMTALVSDWSLLHIKFHGSCAAAADNDAADTRRKNSNKCDVLESSSCEIPSKSSASSTTTTSSGGSHCRFRTRKQVQAARRTIMKTLQP